MSAVARAAPAGRASKLRPARLLHELEVAAPTLRRDAALGEVVADAVAAGAVRLLRHDPGVRLGTDPEDVHQARVAARRLRSDLRTFGAVLERESTESLRAELGWLASVLGVQRDADVLLDRLRDHARRLPATEARGAAGLVRRLEVERSAARDALLAALDGDRYLALLDTLAGYARRPPLLAGAAEPAARVLATIVGQQWKRLARAVASLDDDPDDAALHQVRIRAKRVRYAAEASIAVGGRRAERLAQSVARLQGVLGDVHDAAVAEAWLRATAPKASPTQAFAAGRLACIDALEYRRARAAWPAAWRAARHNMRRWPS